jgi:hypothetical protein
MNKTHNLQMKLSFLVFTLLLAVVISGAASAALQLPEQSYTSAYVVETGYSFTGSASIQDAADNYETMDGYTVLLEPGNHDEQVVVNKNLTFTGMGANPEDTVIQAYSDDGATLTIAPGMAVVLENLSVWNYGSGQAILNNGQLTIINCFVNGNYVANEVTGAAAGGTTTDTITDTTTETMLLMASEDGTTEITGTTESTTEVTGTIEGTTEVTGSSLTTEVMDETPTTTGTSTDTTGDTEGTTTTNSDPGIPLASLASGMLMVMGGTVVSGRKHP